MQKNVIAGKMLVILVLVLSLQLAACKQDLKQEITARGTMTIAVDPQTLLPTPEFTAIGSGFITVPPLIPAITPDPSPPIVENTAQKGTACQLGLGLRDQTVEVLLNNKSHKGFIMAASFAVAENYFPEFEGWFRVLGAPSLDSLRDKAERAKTSGLEYEGLAYGLETGTGTPDDEWQNLVASSQAAKSLAGEYNKLLVMGPGFQLLDRNRDLYAPMAAAADIWMLQTQQLQKLPPGSEYRQEVEGIITLLRTGNPDIQVWAQITLPPDRQPDAKEWHAYRASILDLVDGTYIGVYTWEKVDHEVLIRNIESIFNLACQANS